MNAPAPDYRGERVALLTRHGKQHVLRPVIEPALGCRIEHTDAFDTDRLGAFTREIARAGTQIEAATRKARLALSITGARVAVASEGSFGAGPYGALVPWNVECVLWLDERRALQVIGWAQGPAMSVQRELRTRDDLDQLARDAGCPQHRLVLRPEHPDHPALHKGLDTAEALGAAFAECQRVSSDGRVWAESDLRAHCNPTRQAVIRQAAEDLVRRLQSKCPTCRAPGYWIDSRVPGRPCRECGIPTREPVAERWRCVACDRTEDRPVDHGACADPARCDQCNP